MSGISGLEAMDVLTEARIDPSNVKPVSKFYKVGDCVTVDGWGESIPARMVVVTGKDQACHGIHVFAWELWTQDESGTVLDRGEWKTTLAGAWMQAQAMLEDRTRILLSW